MVVICPRLSDESEAYASMNPYVSGSISENKLLKGMKINKLMMSMSIMKARILFQINAGAVNVCSFGRFSLGIMKGIQILYLKVWVGYKQQKWRQIECRGNFPCRVWEISFANRIFCLRKIRVCLPLFLLLYFFALIIILLVL